jgi:predicted dehydrogenase
VDGQAKINVGIVGLGFGAEFVPIYKAHPNVERVGICELDEKRLNEIGDRHGVQDRFSTFEELLDQPWIDAIHILSTVPFHVEQTLAVLNSGRHCACAVPMATDLEDLRRIVTASRSSGRNYMMMETMVYSRQFLYAKAMLDSGELGNLTFLRGTYYQDVSGSYPRYWWAMPPMHYATHALGPVLALADTRATKVSCFGSGHLAPHIQQPGGNTFPLQTAIFRLEGTDVAVEVTRSWFQVARAYTEGFSVYGDKKGFEWQLESEDPIVFTLEPIRQNDRWRDAPGQRVKPPLRPDLYPPELAPYADGWHGGSHPHLVHEFISSIVEGRPPRIDAVTAADWCAAGICADLSSKRDGEMVEVPNFSGNPHP